MSPLFYYKQKKMGTAMYVSPLSVITSAKAPHWPSHDQRGARSSSSVWNCSEASLGYRPLFTGGFCGFFLCFVQFYQADHLIPGVFQSHLLSGACIACYVEGRSVFLGVPTEKSAVKNTGSKNGLCGFAGFTCWSAAIGRRISSPGIFNGKFMLNVRLYLYKRQIMV